MTIYSLVPLGPEYSIGVPSNLALFSAAPGCFVKLADF
jgi:hypothetical protein